ncbi:unnamed protein product [Paramecium sonneborni]|uniref:aspartyl aminopeptidase n=1 Tax=Paramecium sonneborni TaxID=65129 RepID=A0A8S1NFH3_9CILI|nr:unnamed protein product [Paramecium sonneborni]
MIQNHWCQHGQSMLRLAPVSKLDSNGFLQTRVSSGLWHIQFDRELTSESQIVFKKDNVEELIIPLLKNLYEKYIIQPFIQQLIEIAFFCLRSILNIDWHLKTQYRRQTSFENKNYLFLLNLITEQTSIPTFDIMDVSLYFSDCQPPSYFGMNVELISSSRIDNLFSSFFVLLSITN